MSLLEEQKAMASTMSLLAEQHFLCSLCKDIFSSPVTTPCGHSFCLPCLCEFWSRHQCRYCPQCRRLFSNRPDLCINRILADLADNYKQNRPEKQPKEEIVIDVEQMIQERQQKIEEFKHTLTLQKSSYLREVRESHKVFSALVTAMEKRHKAVVTEIEGRQKEEEEMVETLVKDLEEEIQQLKEESFDYQQITDECTDSVKQLNMNIKRCCNIKDWSGVTVESDPCLGVTRRALTDMMDKLKVEVNRLSKSELKKVEKYRVDINLSAKTAHPCLSVTDDRKQVRHTDKFKEVPEHPKRFDRVANVLGKESFRSGRCYWEVDVGEKVEWTLGVARQSVNRKGKFTVCPANGFWTLSLKVGGQYVGNSSPATPLALEQRPKRVGVFLDYNEGRVSFFCGESGQHIYTFTDAFTDQLHPFFTPGRLQGGKNAAPLRICSNFCSI